MNWNIFAFLTIFSIVVPNFALAEALPKYADFDAMAEQFMEKVNSGTEIIDFQRKCVQHGVNFQPSRPLLGVRLNAVGTEKEFFLDIQEVPSPIGTLVADESYRVFIDAERGPMDYERDQSKYRISIASYLFVISDVDTKKPLVIRGLDQREISETGELGGDRQLGLNTSFEGKMPEKKILEGYSSGYLVIDVFDSKSHKFLCRTAEKFDIGVN